MAITTPFPGGNFLTSGPAGADGRDGRDGGDGAPGQNGQNGQDGQDGRDGAGIVVPRIASTRILPVSAVVQDGPFNVVPADPSNPAHCGLVIGVTAAGGEAGATIAVQNAGDLDLNGVSGNFLAGDTLFPAANGTLTNIAPTIGWRQIIAKAGTRTRIAINLGMAYRLRDAASPLIIPGDTAFVALLIAAFTPDVTKVILSNLRDSLPELPATGTPDPGWYRNGGLLYEHKA